MVEFSSILWKGKQLQLFNNYSENVVYFFSSESIECTVIEIVSAKYTERHITIHGSFLYAVVFTCKGYLLISVVSGINTCCSSYRY